RDIAQRRLRLGFDLRLALGASTPAGNHEPRAAFHQRLEFVVRRHAFRALLAELDRSLEQVLLDGSEQRANLSGQALHRRRQLLARGAAWPQAPPTLDLLS